MTGEGEGHEERNANEIKDLRIEGVLAPELEERYNAVIEEMIGYAELEWEEILSDEFYTEHFTRMVSRRVTLWENEMNTVLSTAGQSLRIRIRYNMETDELHVGTRDFE